MRNKRCPSEASRDFFRGNLNAVHEVVKATELRQQRMWRFENRAPMSPCPASNASSGPTLAVESRIYWLTSGSYGSCRKMLSLLQSRGWIS